MNYLNRKFSNINILSVFFIIIFFTASCTNSIFRDEKADKSIKKDLATSYKLDFSEYSKDVIIIAYDGSVLLTGYVPTTSARDQISSKAATHEDVHKIFDELIVRSPRNLSQKTADNVLANSIKARLFTDRKILSKNFEISVIQGSVYIIGWARSQKEHNKIVEKIKSVSGVNKVVSYIKEIK